MVWVWKLRDSCCRDACFNLWYKYGKTPVAADALLNLYFFTRSIKMKNFADVHIHLSDFDFGKTYETLETVRAQGVTDVALQALGYRSVAYNLAMLYWKIRYTKMRVKVFGAMHLCDRYANVPFEEQAEKLIGLGVDGIKLIDMCPDIRQVTGKGVNDVKYDKMLSLLEKKGIPVLLHSADPETFWDKPDGAYCDGTFLSKQELYDETFEMLEKHPDLKIVLAHFFFLSDFPEEAAKVLDKYPNVCFDLTPGCEMYPNFSKRRDVWREFFIKYSDRILFGTDTNSVKNFNAEINELVLRALTEKGEFVMPCYRSVKIRGLDLPADALENICYNNYVRFTGDKTAEVNRKELYESCEKLLNVMLSEPYDPVYERCAKYLPMLASDLRQSKAITVLKNILNEKV